MPFPQAVSIAAGYDSEYYGSPIANQRDEQGHRGALPDADNWSTYRPSKLWLPGYDDEQRRTNSKSIFNYGSCEDCPQIGSPASWNPNEQTVAKRVYEFNHVFLTARPLPQMYKVRYLSQWYNVRWYGKNVHNENIVIRGVIAQCGANCDDQNRVEPFNCVPLAYACTGSWQPYAGNAKSLPPYRAWQALLDTLSL